MFVCFTTKAAIKCHRDTRTFQVSEYCISRWIMVITGGMVASASSLLNHQISSRVADFPQFLSSARPLRSNNNLKLQFVPRPRPRTRGDRAFRGHSRRPVERSASPLRFSDSVISFKSQLKSLEHLSNMLAPAKDISAFECVYCSRLGFIGAIVYVFNLSSFICG